jgi:hypothetical protein
MALSIDDVQANKAEFDAQVAILGYDTFVKQMKRFSPELLKEMNREINYVLKPIADKAKKLVPDQPLSGWKYGGDGARYPGDSPEAKAKGGSGLPYWNDSLARSGIRVKKGGRREKGSFTKDSWSVLNDSKAGAALEFIGVGTPTNSFIDAVKRQHGKPGRLIWRAWDEVNGDNKVRAAVVLIINDYQRSFMDEYNRK